MIATLSAPKRIRLRPVRFCFGRSGAPSGDSTLLTLVGTASVMPSP
jgi:hypothetical protein